MKLQILLRNNKLVILLFCSFLLMSYSSFSQNTTQVISSNPTLSSLTKGDTLAAFKKEQLVQIALKIQENAILKQQLQLEEQKSKLLQSQIRVKDSIVLNKELQAKQLFGIIENDSLIIKTNELIIESKNKEIKKHKKHKKFIAGGGGIIIIILLILL